MALSLRTLGSGQVDYHDDRPILHFGTSPEEARHIALRQQLRQQNQFEITERMPS